MRINCKLLNDLLVQGRYANGSQVVYFVRFLNFSDFAGERGLKILFFLAGSLSVQARNSDCPFEFLIYNFRFELQILSRIQNLYDHHIVWHFQQLIKTPIDQSSISLSICIFDTNTVQTCLNFFCLMIYPV